MTAAYNAGQNIGAVLGDLLTGKNREPGKAYYDALGQGYEIQGKKSRSEEAFEKASIARSMNLARDGINADVLARARAGDKQAEAELGAAILRSAQTPNLRNYTGGALDLQELGMRQAAAEAGIGELGAMNGNLAAIRGTPVERTKISGGVAYDSYAAGGNVRLTPLGEADIRDKAAGGGFAPRGSGRSSRGSDKRSAAEAKAIIKALEKQMNRTLTAAEVATVYDGGDFQFKDAPAGKTVKAHPRPPAAAIAALWKNPSLQAQFAAKYGPEAAKVAMQKKPK